MEILWKTICLLSMKLLCCRCSVLLCSSDWIVNVTGGLLGSLLVSFSQPSASKHSKGKKKEQTKNFTVWMSNVSISDFEKGLLLVKIGKDILISATWSAIYSFPCLISSSFSKFLGSQNQLLYFCADLCLTCSETASRPRLEINLECKQKQSLWHLEMGDGHSFLLHQFSLQQL